MHAHEDVDEDVDVDVDVEVEVEVDSGPTKVLTTATGGAMVCSARTEGGGPCRSPAGWF